MAKVEKVNGKLLGINNIYQIGASGVKDKFRFFENPVTYFDKNGTHWQLFEMMFFMDFCKN